MKKLSYVAHLDCFPSCHTLSLYFEHSWTTHGRTGPPTSPDPRGAVESECQTHWQLVHFKPFSGGRGHDRRRVPGPSAGSECAHFFTSDHNTRVDIWAYFLPERRFEMGVGRTTSREGPEENPSIEPAAEVTKYNQLFGSKDLQIMQSSILHFFAILFPEVLRSLNSLRLTSEVESNLQYDI